MQDGATAATLLNPARVLLAHRRPGVAQPNKLPSTVRPVNNQHTACSSQGDGWLDEATDTGLQRGPICFLAHPSNMMRASLT